MKKNKFLLKPLTVAIVLGFTGAVNAQDASQTKDLGTVVITSGQPSSLPTQIPTTMETVTAKQIAETINATDSEDALKYLPSLSVRKRYAGDYNHAVLASRASGSQNAARSAVYADGMPLSNFVGNDKFYAPRWGMVAPEEIERVDVMYGPFSAAYPGNSVGAVVDYVTRMPTQFEAHMKVGAFNQRFDTYNTDSHFGGANASATLGSKEGSWSYWFHLSRQDVNGQPMGFVTAAPVTGKATGTAVSGVAVATDVYGAPSSVLGTTTQYHTIQDHAKLKIAYDFSSTMRATYTLGYWQNNSDGNPSSYLTNSAGAPVYVGSGANTVVEQGGKQYALSNTAFSASRENLTHYMHGVSLKTNTQDVFDWEVLASLYDYQQDLNRSSPSNTASALYAGTTAGKITDYGGTGSNNLALKGTWRPEGVKGAHIVDFGYQQDNYTLKIAQNNTSTSNWETASASGAPVSQSGGKSQLQSIYAQDAWKFAPLWKSVLGLRAEQWSTDSGLAYTSAVGTAVNYPSRVENYLSPKAAISHLLEPDLMLKASTGRAVRMPTVHEMYGSTTAAANVSYANNPNLQPEKSQTTELTAEKDLGHGLLRLTAFFEDTRDAIVSQPTLVPGSTTVATNIQNIGRIKSQGLEVAYAGSNVFTRGLDFSSSVTYVESLIKENPFAPDSIDKQQIRVPVWRANTLANYHWSDQLSTAVGARYAGRQYGLLNNSDINGFAYTGNSKLFVVDTRVLYRVDKQWSVAAGIDNLNNYRYWNYHQYPMRTYHAELKWDL
jgi:iron complex outermembrane receptor protein